MSADPLARWTIVGVVATAVIVLSVPAWLLRRSSAADEAATEQAATFVGREACRPCHERAYADWQGSDHDLAMDVATEATVLGDFDDAIFVSKGS